MESSGRSYIQVIVPLRLEWEPYYVLDGDEIVEVGDFVAVPFAGRRYIGVVSACGATLPAAVSPSAVREIYSIHSEIPPVLPTQLEFWRKVASYYMCTVGEVLKMACPATRSSYSAPRKCKPAGEGELSVERAACLDACAEFTGHSPLYDAVVAGMASIPRKPLFLESSLDTGEMMLLCAKTAGNVLWLVPELSDLKLLEKKLRPVFGSALLVFNQELTPARRRSLESTMAVSPHILIGTKGALFLPFRSLDLIVVQDEHSPAYKQTSISPRYSGRDAAVMLSGVYACPIMLQSPMPSLETVCNCRQNKYRKLVFVNGAVENLKDVEITVIDTKAELRKNGMAGDVPKKILTQCRGGGISFVKLRKALFPKPEELEPQLIALFGEECFFSDDPVLRPVPADTQVLCVFGIDSLLTRNDFRADERALQELYKVMEPCTGSLRKVFVMTRQASHSVFSAAGYGNVQGGSLFDFERLLDERRSLALPPFSRMVDIHLRGESRSGGDDDGRLDRIKGWLGSYVPSISAAAYPVEDGWRVIFPKDRTLLDRKASLVRDVEKAMKELKCAGMVSFDVDP